LPALEAQYNQSPRTQEVFIYRGAEGVKNYFKDILKTGADLYLIGGAGFLFLDEFRLLLAGFNEEARTLGLKQRIIFYQEQKELVEKNFHGATLAAKFFPAGKNQTTNIAIFGDQVVSIVAEEKEFTFYVAVDEKLAKGYQQIFETLWQSLPEEGSNIN